MYVQTGIYKREEEQKAFLNVQRHTSVIYPMVFFNPKPNFQAQKLNWIN